MSVVAETAASRSTARRRRPRVARRPFAGGVLWIVLLGALLAGVVAVNVVVLQLNVELDRFGRERAQLKADTARLRAQLSSASASVRIETQARTHLGLVPADPLLTTYASLDGAGS